ncbi:hypothetical protein PZA11_001262 [Diplocarpon coronariae]|uniref:C2H2-type domain-containing protein n=1 Tax=Diplocarpon coronariae TaxID=2795749 RepID=A0A218ZAA4_9HELO|nr:hypothetical protein B2J93_4244 [Marssonina coronariae]
MDNNNMHYLPDVPSYDANNNYGSAPGNYWQQNAYAQNDAQPTRSAPFFQAEQGPFPAHESQPKQAAMFNFTGIPGEAYAGFPGPMSTPPATNDVALSQGQHTPATWIFRTPPSKRQRISSTAHPRYRNPHVSSNLHTAEPSACGNQSECCSSCSEGPACDEAECSPCEEPQCVDTAVELCSDESCVKPACRDECFFVAFQNQATLGQGDEVNETKPPSRNAPWNLRLARQGMGRMASLSANLDRNAIDHSPTPTTPPMAGHSETPGSPYSALPTPLENMFDQQFVYPDPAPSDLSGTGALFSNSEQWLGNSYGSMNSLTAPEGISCSWEGCEFVGMSHDEWAAHFHMEHIDSQMAFGCPIPAGDCPTTISTNPMDHLQNFHGYTFDFSSGSLICPDTNCPTNQTYLSPRMLHDHFDLAHAIPAQGSLHCRLQTCGTVFDEPGSFISHMNCHLQAPFSDIGEDIDLLGPSLSAPAASLRPEITSKQSEAVHRIPHLCLWKVNGGELCRFEGTSASNLQDHVKDHHLQSLGKNTGYICLWDGCRRDQNLGEKSGFSQRGKLERHMATHTGFKCSECPTCHQLFSAPQALRQHMLLHTGEKPWKCKHCDKRFPQQSACTIHERTHTHEKPLECNICHKKFSESSNLAKHRKIHGEKGLHVCPVTGCEKSFHRLDQLKRHALTHDKPPKDPAKKRAPRTGKGVVTCSGEEPEMAKAKAERDGEDS